MERLTKTLAGIDQYVVDEDAVCKNENGYSGEAIDKLAKFENAYGHLLAKQQKLTEEMQRLKSDGKTKSARFKQLLAEKLMNSQIIILFGTYGL